MTTGPTRPTRRGFLRGSAAVTAAVAGAPALVGCGTSTARSAANVGTDPVPWPTHIPLAGPEPDLPPDPRGVDAGFLRYPDRLTSATAERPGNGERITALVESYESPPRGPDRNRYWAALNEALGVDLDLQIVPSANLGHKIATLMASGDMPDLLMIRNWMPRIADYVVNEAADLSEHLAGDAVADYPSLANLPTYAWQDMGLMAGRIHGVPIVRPRTGSTIIANREALTEAAGDAYNAWDADAFVAALRAATGGNHYGFGVPEGGWAFGAPTFAGWFGAPNLYGIDDSGAFVRAELTEEYRAAVEFTARLHLAEKVYYPGTATLPTTTLKSLFFNGTVRSHLDNLSGYQTEVPTVGDAFTVDLLRPPTGLAPRPATHFGGGTYGAAILKPAPPARIRMLLRLLNYLASPFGTREHQLVNYGLEGVHFTLEDGEIVPTELASTENPSVVPVKYLTAPPPVHYFPGNPDAARRAHAHQVAEMEYGIPPLTSGLVVRESRLTQQKHVNLFFDAIMAIVQGRDSMRRWDEAIRTWRTDGGDRVDAELQAEYEAVHGR
ncbi:extracellular solute-binding protein [Streptomyces sp. 3MP-14]|uniref:Extracellular solute-binding protein n=1 Tax=Streptomyces mimosae TaxID=2586635 RepID=A0A5N5ZMD1_9ACTN|nr:MULTISPECIES: extracellular solute-binding protein [Streptomyces]KAB8157062.1 extracellular solute-binding protein [Streptomyces mimosae]KAB8172222.1 extracellular solute-binding protein [Streptomyces sp. 3MP-14]